VTAAALNNKFYAFIVINPMGATQVHVFSSIHVSSFMTGPFDNTCNRNYKTEIILLCSCYFTKMFYGRLFIHLVELAWGSHKTIFFCLHSVTSLKHIFLVALNVFLFHP
jgi:hypothetical protein